MRQAGVIRAATVEEAFEAAATFATQPLPKGPNVVVVTTAGGWGVVTADAITRHRDLVLVPLPDDLRAAIDTKLPPRWSRSNPVDLAGAETRDTIPEVLAAGRRAPRRARRDLPRPRHPVEPGQADAQRPLLPGPRARAHRRVPRAPGRPVRRDGGRRSARPPASRSSTATELAVADPDNPGPGRGAAPPGGSATRRPTAPSPRSGTCTATPASVDAVNVVTDRSRRAGRRRLVALLRGGGHRAPGAAPVGGDVVGHHRRAGASRRRWPWPAASTGAAHVATPLLSARRVPGMVTGQLATKDLLSRPPAVHRRPARPDVPDRGRSTGRWCTTPTAASRCCRRRT